MGAFALVRFVIQEVVKPSGQQIRVDWHGHCDRGLAIANSMAALMAGAECVHACALGVGERVGNTQMDQMLVNLKLMEVAPWAEQDLTGLKQYCGAVSKATGVPIPPNYPVVGEDAFRTATGVHAAAVIKAYKKNDIELANAVYSGVPSQMFGLEQIIDIGPMSGKSNVLFWLERHGVPFEGSLCPDKTSYPTNRHYLYYSGSEPSARDVAPPAPRGHRVRGRGTSGKLLFARLAQSGEADQAAW